MKTNSSDETESRWQKTPVANLVRHVPSGNYYARIRVRGKLIWKSLKTDRISVAKLRLGDFHKEERQRAAAHTAVARGKMTFGAALETYRERLKGDYALKDRSKTYRQERIAALLKSWPDLEQTDVSQISKTDCLEWATRFGQKASPSAFNNTAGTLRLVLDIALEAGARYDNPATQIKRKKIRQKLMHLPSQEQFPQLVKAIRDSDGGWGGRCGNLVEFLAYSGCRKGEAARVEGRHCDFEKNEIAVLGDPVTGTKNWEIRRVPMIPEMRRLLERIRGERGETEFAANPVMPIHECQGAINTACKKLGIARFTHHDLRHLFATYGHLRDQHSANMAQKVVFTETATNVVPLPLAATHQVGEANTADANEKKAIAQAKAKYGYPWWASKNAMEVFWGQLNETVQIVPLDKFHACAREAMSREVFPDELADRQPLKEEFAERIPKVTLVELTGKIQAKVAEKELKAS
jgi:integrase